MVGAGRGGCLAGIGTAGKDCLDEEGLGESKRVWKDVPNKDFDGDVYMSR